MAAGEDPKKLENAFHTEGSLQVRKDKINERNASQVAARSPPNDGKMFIPRATLIKLQKRKREYRMLGQLRYIFKRTRPQNKDKNGIFCDYIGAKLKSLKKRTRAVLQFHILNLIYAAERDEEEMSRVPCPHAHQPSKMQAPLYFGPSQNPFINTIPCVPLILTEPQPPFHPPGYQAQPNKPCEEDTSSSSSSSSPSSSSSSSSSESTSSSSSDFSDSSTSDLQDNSRNIVVV